MSDQERIERARARCGAAKEISKSHKKADKIEWRKQGSVVILVHPESDFHKRARHWLPTMIETEETLKGQKVKVKKLVRIPYNCPADPETKDGCPVCDFRQRLKDDESIVLDTPVLRFGVGREEKIHTKACVIGDESGDHDRFPKDRDLYPKRDFVGCAVVARLSNGKEPEKVRPQVLEGAITLLEAINTCIAAEQGERGEDEGNPWLNPYAIRLTYDEAKPIQMKYDARALSKYAITNTVQAALEAEVCDVSDEISTDGMADKLRKLINAANILDVEEAAEQVAPTRSGKSLAEIAKQRRAEQAAPAAPAVDADGDPVDSDGNPVDSDGEDPFEVESAPAAAAKPAAAKPAAAKPAPAAAKPAPAAAKPAAAKPVPAAAKPAAAKPVPAAAKPAAAKPVPAAVEEEETFLCPECASAVPVGAGACPSCGAEMVALGEESPF